MAPYEISPVSGPGSPNRRSARLHDGFYLRMGVGYGHLSMDLTADSEPATEPIQASGDGAVFSLWVGGSPVPGLVLGAALLGHSFSEPQLESAGQSASAKDSSMSVGSFGPFLQVYPAPRYGFYLQGFVGYTSATLEMKTESGTASSTPSTGVGLGIGTGYDFWIADQWSLGVEGRLLYASLSSTCDPGSTTCDAVTSTGQPVVINGEDDTVLLPTLSMTSTLH